MEKITMIPVNGCSVESINRGMLTTAIEKINEMVDVVNSTNECILTIGNEYAEIRQRSYSLDSLNERINKLEDKSNTTSASVEEQAWIKKEKQLDDDFEKEMRKLKEEYDQKLVYAIEMLREFLPKREVV